MKTTSILVKAFVLSLIIINASCSSDSKDSNSGTPAVTDKTTFKLDGVLITADETTATLYTNPVAGGEYIDVYATKDGVEVLELHMPASVGNYPAQRSGFTMTESWLTYETGGTDPILDNFHSDSGTMNLTTCDLTADELRGTFSFIGNNGTTTKNITEGKIVVSEITRL